MVKYRGSINGGIYQRR